MSPEQAALDELVDDARAGDAAALEQLLAGVRDDVYGIALRMLWHPDDAEDATQEVLVKVLTRLDSFRGEASVRTWVYRIAVNHLLDRKRSPLEQAGIGFDQFGADLLEGLSDPRPELAPDAAVLAEEVKLGCTLAMLTCLDRDHRVAWILGEVFGVDSAEGGWICEISAAAYRKRLSRARSRLRAFVRGNCGLVDPANACRCHRRVNVAVDSGRVDPERPVFVGHRLRSGAVHEATGEMEQLHTAASLFRSHPDYAASDRLGERLKAIVSTGDLRILREP